MGFHTKFVLSTLIRRSSKWNAQQRAGAGTGWNEAARAHGPATLTARAWLAGVYWFSPTVVVWLLPVAIPLLLPIPLSRASLGRAARRCRLFIIPEERFPPPVLDDLQALTTAPKKMHPPLRHAGPHAAAHKRAEKALPDFAGVPMSRELASAPVPRIWTTPSDL